MHAGARAYRDLVGIAHQRFAAQADEVHLLVAGLPLTLKGAGRDERPTRPHPGVERSPARDLEPRSAIRPLDADGDGRGGRAHLDRLTKPPGSLGRLETLVVQLAGITGRPTPPVARRAIVVAAGDHGVTRRRASRPTRPT